MVAWLTKQPVWLAWVIVGFLLVLGAAGVFFGLWRHAAKLASDYKAQRDGAQRSAERERTVAEERRAAEDEAAASTAKTEERREELAEELANAETAAAEEMAETREKIAADGSTARAAEEWFRSRRGP